MKAENRITQAVRRVYGKDGDEKVKQMHDLIEGAAQTMLLRDKVFQTLLDQDLMIEEEGSKGQTRKTTHPLLQVYTALTDRFLDYQDKLGLTNRKAATRPETVNDPNQAINDLLKQLNS